MAENSHPTNDFQAPGPAVPPPRTLCLLLSQRYGKSRSIIRGLLDGLGDRSRWQIELCEPWPWTQLPRLLSRRPSGFVVGHQGRDGLQALAASGIPAVVIGNPGPAALPAVGDDQDAAMRLIVRHFQELRFARLAWLGFRGDQASEHLRQALIIAAATAGLPCRCCPDDDAPCGEDPLPEEGPLATWLRDLPEFTGLICANDLLAWRVLTICRRLGVAVPGRLAVLGIDNDDLLCQLAEPPLSSLDTDPLGMGRQAAALLLAQLDGQVVPPGLRHVPPRALVQRQSTALVATADPLVRWAVDWIRIHLDQELTIKRLVASSGLKRRSIEVRFRQALGRSPLAEIQRQQVEMARLLLGIEGLTPAQAAHRLGLSSAQHLNRLCKRVLGVTPMELR